MGGVIYTAPTQDTGAVCTTDQTNAVLSTDLGVLLWQAPEPVFVGVNMSDAAYRTRNSISLRVSLTRAGTPFLLTPPGVTPRFFEGTSQLAGDFTVACQFTTDGTSGGMALAHAVVFSPDFEPIGPNANGLLTITNLSDRDGYAFGLTIHGPVTKTQADSVETCGSPIGGPPSETPTPIPTPQPTTPPQQVKVQANDLQPSVTLDWRHDDRWPELVQIDTPGLVIAVGHPRLTGSAGPRKMLLTGVQWHFVATNNPVGEHVEQTFTLERLPNTKADGSNLFLTFDDPTAGFNAGLLV